MTAPDFTKLAALEEAALAARLDAIRATITHGGEKGRALEQAVLLLLRDILPAEYGLSTGFVAYRADGEIKLSRQLDIIIYDAVRTGPLARLTACDVFPLEAVYGYVEIKATIQSSSDEAKKPADNSIEHCLAQNQELRRMIGRWFHYQSSESPVASRRKRGSKVSIRSYVIAFAAEGEVASDAKAFAQRMADVSRHLGDPTHLHGVFVANTGFFRTRPVDPRSVKPEDKFHVDYVTENRLSVFKADLLHTLARFPRFEADLTPALEDYFAQPKWSSCAPKIG